MEIVFFLFGLLAITPICLLAMNDRRTHTLHVHHWHHRSRQARPPAREPVERRYQVITGGSSAYVLDVATGATCPIVEPMYTQLLEGKR